MDNISQQNKLYNETEIIDAFIEVQYGKPLPKEGPCFFFYNSINALGGIFIINDSERFEIFNADHDHIISTLDFEKYNWDITSNGDTITLALVLKWEDDLNILNFNFLKNNPNSIRMLNSIKEEKEIKINFLNLLYGELVKEKSHIFPIQNEILSQMNF